MRTVKGLLKIAHFGQLKTLPEAQWTQGQFKWKFVRMGVVQIGAGRMGVVQIGVLPQSVVTEF